MSKLSFISDKDLEKHVIETIKQYGDKLKPFDIKRFNKNIIDPVKFAFDKEIYHLSWDELIKNEIFRQRDKSNNNDIGYFHQRIFQYIANCEVPNSGWDIEFSKKDGIELADGDKVSRVFVEMKNKHNTMNSASAGKTYIKMQAQLLQDDDCACFLVEAIAKKSQDIAWAVSVDGQKKKHRRIRRVSMDKFYELVTGQEDAFYQLCMVLPGIIANAVKKGKAKTPNDTVFEELKTLAKEQGKDTDLSMLMAMYMLGFGSYSGFEE